MTLRVVCLNLWGGILFEEMVTFCRQQNADLYLFQEVFASDDRSLDPKYQSLRILQEELGLAYVHFAPAFIENELGKKIPQGNAILSRFPIHEVSTLFYDVAFGERVNEWSQFHLTPRNLQHVLLTIEGRQLHVLNTQGIWGEDGEDSERRLAMIEKILAEVRSVGEEPLLLAGDFNVRDTTHAIALLNKHLQNVFKGELTTSFNIKQKDLKKFPGFAVAVVDMMFVSPNIRVLSHECPQVDVSDHLPLLATLEW